MKKKVWVTVIVAVSTVGVLLSGVFLIGAGYAEKALDTVIRWGEDGTLDQAESFIRDELPPLLIAAGAATAAVVAALHSVIKKIREASENFDKATKENVKSVELSTEAREEMTAHNAAMEKRMIAFMSEIQTREEARAAEQRATLDAFMKEMRADAASERAKTRRIEGGVNKLVRMEVLAHGADDGLVKKGVANEISKVADEPCEEGGDDDDEGERPDGKAVAKENAYL